ncbi:hypothetical protein K439DRAFT_1634554, partial [Ramaria rubella]
PTAMTTTSKQLKYSATQIPVLHPPSGSTANYHVDVQNNWDPLTEVAIASYSEPSVQLDHLSILLESHGVVVHRVSASRPHLQASPTVPATLSPFVTDLYASPVRSNGTGRRTAATKSRPLSLFMHNAALIYGTRVIEAPPRPSSSDVTGSQSEMSFEHPDVLFNLFEEAGVEVIRWLGSSPSSGKVRLPEGKLVDIEETDDGTETEEDGPLFSPSDILIISPTLLITRLSSCTNNKGLEYLWSVLSQPAKNAVRRSDDDRGKSPAPGQNPIINTERPSRTTTTLLVRITEPEVYSANTPATPSTTFSPRTPTLSNMPKHCGSASYTPLSRALVPIEGRVMLYDPVLVAEGEARRLKSVLDRVQEGSRSRGSGGVGNGSMGDMSDIFIVRSSKRDSGMSYGTFGSVNLSDDEGWQFISVNGLHLTSILLVSPRLVLVGLAPLTTTGSSPILSPNQDALTNVSQVLESLGMRTVKLPSSELNEKGGGVRDAVMVLRREVLDDDAWDDEHNENEEQREWARPLVGEDGPATGCFDAITASISAFFCGIFGGFTSTSHSVTNISESV